MHDHALVSGRGPHSYHTGDAWRLATVSPRVAPMSDLTVVTPDGRRLTVTELGEPDGVPIVFHHGTPGNRAAHNRAPEVLVGSRAIFYDRPGYGGSDRQCGRTVADCAGDVAAIVDTLGIDRFAVFGSSGGGPHALACGAVLGERVQRVAVVAGFAPSDDPELDFLDGMSDLNIAELQAALEGESELIGQLQEAVEAAAGNPDAILDEIAAELSEADRRALARPEVRVVFREAIGAAVSGGLSGWIDDDLAFARPWGFELSAVGQEVLLLQGEHDLLVPRAHMDYIARKVRNARLTVVPGEGHTLFDETKDVVQWLCNKPCNPVSDQKSNSP